MTLASVLLRHTSTLLIVQALIFNLSHRVRQQLKKHLHWSLASATLTPTPLGTHTHTRKPHTQTTNTLTHKLHTYAYTRRNPPELQPAVLMSCFLGPKQNGLPHGLAFGGPATGWHAPHTASCAACCAGARAPQARLTPVSACVCV